MASSAARLHSRRVGFPSGQRGRAVNPLALPSQVRILPPPLPVNEEARMTSQADFTDEEWTQLKRAPFVAGMAISIADPGGPIEALHETSATPKTGIGAAGAH